MDITKDYNENCELHANDEGKKETSELKQESQPSHVTLHNKKETAEGDENGPLLRGKDPEALESIYKYANRIKSFLGWELSVDEVEEIEKERGETTSETTVENCDSKFERCSRDEDVKKDEDYGSLEKKEEGKNTEKPLENEQDSATKPEAETQMNLMNESELVKGSPTSEVGGTGNQEMNPTTGDESSSSPNNLSGVNLKTFTPNSPSPDSESLPDIHQNAIAPSELEEERPADLKNLISPRDADERDMSEIPVKDSRASNTEPEKSHDTDEAEAGKIISDLKTGALGEKKIQGKDNTSDQSEVISSTNDEQNEAKANGSSENLDQTTESEDATHLDENDPLKNIDKPYMEEIRRLSIDIVKDVIESARNSVHGMFANKSEQQTIAEAESAVHGNEDEICDANGTKILETDHEDGNHNIRGLPMTVGDTYKSAESKEDMNHSRDLKDSKGSFIDEETTCGFGNYKPQWIQKYATPRTYLLLFSIIGVIHGTYYVYFVSIMSTLEKRFAFQTKVSGTLLLADEITPLILGVIVGYIGGKTHRPRMVAIGMFMSAACCILSGMPYLIYGPGKHLTFQSFKNETGPEICEAEVRKQSCESDDRPPTLTVVGIFLLASFLKGFATLSYYVIGISYMDDNAKKKNTPMYLAIAMALRLLGPLCGFIMSSAFLKIYENPLDDPGFGPDDPRWIGAWWMGFFLQGVLLVIFTLPIALFPRRLPNQKKIEKFPTAGPENNIKETLAGLLLALKRLGKNPIFIVLIINTNMKIFGHFGHSIMLPKYMENQFRLSAADASLYSGATSITCIMLSTVFGGFLIWKFRPRIKVLLCGMITSEVVLCVGFLVLMIPRCSPADMLHFGTNDDGLILDSVCNQNCDCSTVSFTPFCGPDGKTTYFSPCYAGCTEEITRDIKLPPSNKQKEFGNCSCVNAPDSLVSNPAKITEGFCPDESCWSQTLAYLIILFFLLAISNTLTVAHTMILLRSVHPADKSVALGTFETFICLFGFIPFPITYGALVDSACLVWEESCGETGNCWFYDMEKYAYLLHGASAFFCSMSTICLITLYFLSNRVKNLYVEEDEEEEYIDNIKLDTVSGSVTKL